MPLYLRRHFTPRDATSSPLSIALFDAMMLCYARCWRALDERYQLRPRYARYAILSLRRRLMMPPLLRQRIEWKHNSYHTEEENIHSMHGYDYAFASLRYYTSLMPLCHAA